MTAACQSRLALLARRSGRSLDDVLELWAERAAIREYEGDAKRREAERMAEDDVANEVLGYGEMLPRATVSVAAQPGGHGGSP